MLLLYSFLVSVRDPSVGTDTAQYIDLFRNMRSNQVGERSLEPGFVFLTKFFALQSSHEVYLFSLTLIISFAILVKNFSGFTRNFGLHSFLWMCYPFFYSLTLNILRQGVAWGLVFGFILTKKRNWFSTLLLVLISAAFHYSAFVFSLLALGARRISFNVALLFWVVSVVCGFLEVVSRFQFLLAMLPLDYIYYASYFSVGDSEYKTGFRFDFLLFSLIGVFASIFFVLVKNFGEYIAIGEMTVSVMAKTFLLFNGFAFFFIALPYSDRYFAWSWYLYPTFAYFYIIKKYRSLRVPIIALLFLLSCYSIFINLYPT